MEREKRCDVNIRDIRKGDVFLMGSELHTAADDAHQNLDEKDCPWIVYDTEGNSFFEEDFFDCTALTGENGLTPIGTLLRDVRAALCLYSFELDKGPVNDSSEEEKASHEKKRAEIASLILRVNSAQQVDGIDFERQIALIWSAEDVIELRPDLNEKQAMEVLKAVQAHHDAVYGVTWDTLEYEAESLFPK